MPRSSCLAPTRGVRRRPTATSLPGDRARGQGSLWRVSATRKARRRDEKILFRLIDEDDIPDDGLGFHAQQAVEKTIKAVLPADDLPNLSPWAAELRYSRRPEDVPDRPEMRSLVEQTKVWAESQLKGDYDSSSRPIAQLDRATPS